MSIVNVDHTKGTVKSEGSLKPFVHNFTAMKTELYFK